MKSICPHLFVYGTLLHGDNSYGDYLQQNCTLLKTGKFRGKLYDMGEYPGAILNENENDNQYVYGSIYLMDEPEKLLAFIDDYEGFGENQEQPNLFLRQLTSIETNTGTMECWVYLYNLSVTNLPQIPSGRYLK